MKFKDDTDGETEFEEEDVKLDESDDDNNCDKDMINEKCFRFSLVDVVKKSQHFTSKIALKATMEICALENNFDYMLGKSDKSFWYIIVVQIMIAAGLFVQRD